MITHFRKKSTFIGVALHDDKISIAKLRWSKKKIVVEDLSILSFPAESRVDDKAAFLLRQTLKEWVQRHHAEHCWATLALPASQVIHKRIRVSACLNDLECEAEIAANLPEYLPGMNEPLHFDFLPIKQEEQEIELQLIAARSRQIAIYRDAARGAGLQVTSIDVDAYAIARAINFILPLKSSALICDVDIATAQFILMRDSKVFSIYPLVLDAEGSLGQQIKRTLQFLSVTEAIGTIEKILLTGELRQLTRLKKSLQDECGITFDLIHSLGERIETQGDFAISTGLTALGSALRGIR